MAYTPHVLVAIIGGWSSDDEEVWENTVRLRGDGGGGVALDPEAYLTAIKAPLATWFSAVGTNMSPRAQLKTVKVNHVGADGRYVDPGTTHLRDYLPVVGGGAPYTGSNLLPGKTCLAYTWETDLARGPGHRGRIYPPNTFDTNVSPFRVSNANAAINAANGAGLLAVLKNTGGADGARGIPVIASRLAGQITDITAVTSDNIYDVQRRRGNRIPSVRSARVSFA